MQFASRLLNLSPLAFPNEAAQADAAGDLNLLINDITVLRATATFLRTTVTRNTAWDRFLAGDNHALTAKQRRGAKLFFTPAAGGAGGAGCFSCHSGPMLNKQVNDPDVAGVGKFVEENFYNLGLADHPLQALNRVARNDPNFRDDGRREITGRKGDAFKFRVVTLRQLKDARFFFHNGAFTRVLTDDDWLLLSSLEIAFEDRRAAGSVSTAAKPDRVAGLQGRRMIEGRRQIPGLSSGTIAGSRRTDVVFGSL